MDASVRSNKADPDTAIMTGFLIVTGALALIAICAVAYARLRDWI